MRLLTSLGIGAATVDLVLADERVVPGETLAGTVEIDGGNESQTVDEIYGALRTSYRTDDGTRTATITEFDVTDGFTVETDESLSYDVTIDIPAHTPATVFGDTEVWIDTGLDIDWAADPDDKDQLTVEPTASLAALHDAVGSLGFDLKSTSLVDASGSQFEQEFVQKLEYKPISAEYRSTLDELEFLVATNGDGLEATVEIDATDTLVSERETLTELSVTDADEAAVRDQLAELIEKHS